MEMQNDFWDKKLDLEKLKGYVYGLVDPRDKSIFYIGRGGGNEAQGNTRPNCHLHEAIQYIKEATNKKEKAKLEKIKEIWSLKCKVELVILRRGLDLDSAKQVEATLIQAFNYSEKVKLTNMYEGFHNEKYGLINAENAVNLYAVPLGKFDCQPGGVNLWIFPIIKGLKRRIDPFQATISAWKVSKANKDLLGKSINYAIGIDANQISRSVIKIDEWVSDDVYDDPKKCKILGKDVSDSDGQHFFEKSFGKILSKDYLQIPQNEKENAKNNFLGSWLWGKYLIVNIDENKVTYLLGNKLYEEINLLND